MGKSNVFAYGAAFVAIIAWSTSATFGGLLSGKLPFYSLVAAIQIVAVVCLFPFALKEFRSTIAILRHRPSTRKRWPYRATFFLYFACFSAALTIYQLLFYFAMTGPARIYANIANYLWPIFLSIFFHSVFRIGNRKLSWSDNALLFLGFLGSVSLVWDFQLPKSGQSTDASLLGLAAGFCAAVAAGVYMSLSAKLSGMAEDSDIKLSMPTLYFWALLPSSLVLVVLGITLGWSGPSSGADWFYLIWLGVVTVALAQTTWSFAISEGPSNIIPVLAYLVPVLSTALQVLILGDQITPSMLFGITFIVVASVLTARIFRQLLPETGAAIAFMYMGFVLFFKADIFPTLQFEGVDSFPIQIFAILAAFFLSRQWESARDEEQLLIEWQRSVAKVVNLADSTGAFEYQGPLRKLQSQKPDASLGYLLFQLVCKIVDFDQAQSSSQLSSRLNTYRHMETKFLSAVKTRIDEKQDAEEMKDFLEAALNVRSLSAKWIANKSDKASYGEIIIIVTLGMVSIAFYSAVATESAIRGVIAMCVVSSIAYIATRIYDYNIRPTLLNINELVNFQLITERFGSPLYLGKIELLRYGREARYVEREVQGWSSSNELESFHTSAKNNPLVKQKRAQKTAMLFLLLGPIFVLIMNW